jgi:Zn-dependent membrane protease YugP
MLLKEKFQIISTGMRYAPNIMCMGILMRNVNLLECGVITFNTCMPYMVVSCGIRTIKIRDAVMTFPSEISTSTRPVDDDPHLVHHLRF